MFTNRLINDYIYETRFIASWVRKGGKLRYGEDIRKFKKWLRSIGLTKEEVAHIEFLATNGKLELEDSAEEFLNEHN